MTVRNVLRRHIRKEIIVNCDHRPQIDILVQLPLVVKDANVVTLAKFDLDLLSHSGDEASAESQRKIGCVHDPFGRMTSLTWLRRYQRNFFSILPFAH
jgi:hypothetical protein